MPENQLTVKMLGGFSVSWQGKELVIDRSSVSKTTQLLEMLLLYAKDGVAKVCLMDWLYGREDVENKNGSLNNTLFRLRRQLRAAGLPESSYVTIHKGICRWTSEIPVEVDCCRFESMIREGEEEKDQKTRMELLTRACSLYTGEFLPDMIGEDWATIRNVHYRNLYFSCLEELFAWLKERQDYEEIYRLATEAAAIYPYEEWQIWRIDSLIAMARYQEAMDIYQNVTRLFFDELSLTPSPRMLERFRYMSEHISLSSGVIDDVREGLIEREQAKGAYYCNFPSFVDIYHVISRLMERNGTSVYIMLCSLCQGRGTLPEENQQTKEMSGLLRQAILNSLRKCDFYTKYNANQYLIMLSGINQENCSKVSSRIEAAFRRLGGRREYQIDFYVASVAELGVQGEKRSFWDMENIWNL